VTAKSCGGDWHEEALAALDALQTQAETAEKMGHGRTGWPEADAQSRRAEAAEAELKEAYAKLERTNESFLATEAERDTAIRERDHAREALSRIAQDARADGNKWIADFARAALSAREEWCL
jgi:hypothetical protein